MSSRISPFIPIAGTRPHRHRSAASRPHRRARPAGRRQTPEDPEDDEESQDDEEAEGKKGFVKSNFGKFKTKLEKFIAKSFAKLQKLLRKLSQNKQLLPSNERKARKNFSQKLSTLTNRCFLADVPADLCFAESKCSK